MAKQVGPIFMIGTVGDFSFYKSCGQYLVRQKGGPDKKKIKTSPKFERTRENNSEFGACSKTGAFIRRELRQIAPVKDPLAYQRFASLMSTIQKQDPTSARGERKISEGLKQESAKDLFCDFAFNEQRPLEKAIKLRPRLRKGSWLSGKTEVLFNTNHLLFPNGARIALVTAARLRLNLDEKNCLEKSSLGVRITKDEKGRDIKLCLAEEKNANGTVFYFIQVCFYTAEGLPLQKGSLDSLGCIAVDPVFHMEEKQTLLSGAPLPGLKLKRMRNVFVENLSSIACSSFGSENHHVVQKLDSG